MRTKMNRAGRQARKAQPYRKQAKRQFSRTLRQMRRGKAAVGSKPTTRPAIGQLAKNRVPAERKALNSAVAGRRFPGSNDKQTTKERQATRRIGKGTNRAQERRRKLAGKSYDSSLLKGGRKKFKRSLRRPARR